MKVAILRNEEQDSAKKWKIACQKKGLEYEEINLTSYQWFENVINKPFDFFLLRPSGNLSHFKQMYDERLYIIAKILKLTTFPTYEECLIYENKRLLSYFLKANKIPHPSTNVFYSKMEATEFLRHQKFPVIAKTSIGASGTGVKVLKDFSQAKNYVSKAFSNKGIKRSFGPNRSTGSPSKWAEKAIKSPGYFKKKLKQYLTTYKHGESDFLIFQKYIPHNYEWRMVRIGNSYFGHQKVKQGDKASGTKGIDYVDPPKELLNFTKELCEKYNFNFMAVDLFEDGEGGYLVNELQTIFGHVQDYILEVEGKPGRYLYQNKQWIFEEGEFNTNESYDLRLETAIELFKKQNSERS
ncbi:MAG: ATP-grasp domain-containing protein [Candidatus Woesearchaeota archaeon]